MEQTLRPAVRARTAERVGDDVQVDQPTVFDLQDLAVYYGDFRAVRDVNLAIRQNEITAFIGPSGCGKTTVLRCFNRMNDLIETARVEGRVTYHGVDLYDPAVNPVEVRRRIGMVFQKPNPFPKSIYDNVAYGPRSPGSPRRATVGRHRRASLRKAALWDEVKDRLKKSALGLSGGQQQRLCIARAMAVNPEVLLMDEPCSALDPIATGRIEDLMQEIKTRVHDHHRHPQHAAGRPGRATAAPSSPPRSTRPATPAPACSSSTTPPRRSSRTPPTSGPRTTSPAGSADGR